MLQRHTCENYSENNYMLVQYDSIRTYPHINFKIILTTSIEFIKPIISYKAGLCSCGLHDPTKQQKLY